MAELTLRQDGNGDGVLGSVTEDPVVGTAVFAAGKAVFAGLDCELPPGAIAHLFLTADVSLTAAADGDSLAAVIGSGSDLDFDDQRRPGRRLAARLAAPATASTAWSPPRSRAHDVPPVSLTAGEGPVLAFDLHAAGQRRPAPTP